MTVGPTSQTHENKLGFQGWNRTDVNEQDPLVIFATHYKLDITTDFHLVVNIATESTGIEGRIYFSIDRKLPNRRRCSGCSNWEPSQNTLLWCNRNVGGKRNFGLDMQT